MKYRFEYSYYFLYIYFSKTKINGLIVVKKLKIIKYIKIAKNLINKIFSNKLAN